MASVRHLGLLPNRCFPFKRREDVTWRFIDRDPFPVTELGTAPDNAYLKLTKAQATSIFWRVKEWSISWGWDAKEISKTFILAEADGENPAPTVVFDFSYPAASFELVFPARHLFATGDERRLACSIWSGGVPIVIANAANLFEAGNLSITSTETNNFDAEFPVFTFTRDTPGGSVDTGQANSDIDQEQFFDYDVAWVPNDDGLLYWPLAISVNISITDSSSDNFLFDESVPSPNEQFPAGDTTLPPIGGSLRTAPRGFTEDATPTDYNVEILLPDTDSIILPLFDATDPSPRTGTKFNVDGFTGVTIKPHSYWPYDPGDGGGPIYNEETGAQLRPFPS
jgi:hypothetical protein